MNSSFRNPAGDFDGCTMDSDCLTLNARCLVDVPLHSVSPDAVPFNNSLFCYCDLWFAWVGPDCNQLSSSSIALGVSNIVIAVIATSLAMITLADILSLARFTKQGHDNRRNSAATMVVLRSRPQRQMRPGRLHHRSSGSSITTDHSSRWFSRNRMDMQLVTSVLLLLTFLTMAGWMIIDLIRNWAMQTCLNRDGKTRNSCWQLPNMIFMCSIPVIGVPLVLLFSVLMYNASFRVNGMVTLPFTSFWTLLVLDTCLLISLLISAVLENYSIASYAGASLALMSALINMMTSYRLRDFSFIKLLVRCNCCCSRKSNQVEPRTHQKRKRLCCKASSSLATCSVGPLPGDQESPRTRWTIKQKLMAVSLAESIGLLVIFVSLIIRGVFDQVYTQASVEGRVGITAEQVFRWAYLIVFIIYFLLVHYNGMHRMEMMRQRRMAPVQQISRENDQELQGRQAALNNSQGEQTASTVPLDLIASSSQSQLIHVANNSSGELLTSSQSQLNHDGNNSSGELLTLSEESEGGSSTVVKRDDTPEEAIQAT